MFITVTNNNRVIYFTPTAIKAKGYPLFVVILLESWENCSAKCSSKANIHRWDSGTWRKGGQEERLTGWQEWRRKRTPDFDRDRPAQPEAWTWLWDW